MDRVLLGGGILLASVLGPLAETGRALADEMDAPAYFSDEYDVPADRPLRVAPPPPVLYAPAPAQGPAVFGWVAARPASCGQYRYWDGTQCLDARDDPPDVGPRW